MRIEALQTFQGRNPRGYFEDLPWEVKQRAQMWLYKFCERWGRNLPGWRFAILVGQAKRLALNPPTSAWGRSMLAKRGGYATQQKYRDTERIGPKHPAHRAASISAARRKLLTQQQGEARMRERLGLPPKPRRKLLPLG
jgi:hypothetical protein